MRHWIAERLAHAGPKRRSSRFLKVLGSCPEQPHMAKPPFSRASRSRTRRPPARTAPAVQCGISPRKKGNRRRPGKTDRQNGQKEFKANGNPDPDPAQVQGDQEQGGCTAPRMAVSSRASISTRTHWATSRQPRYRSSYPRSDPRDGLLDSLVADESHRVPHATGGRRWRNHHIVEIEAVMLQGHKVALNLLIIGVTQLDGECTWDKPGNLVRPSG